MEYEYIEIDANDPEYPLCQCDDCGYVGRDWSEPSDGSNRMLEDEADVLCPKCHSWMYFCIPEPEETVVLDLQESAEFDREQAIEYLSQCDYDYIINGHEGGLELLWSYLGDGFKGYQNFTDEELQTEVAQRKEMAHS
jgi:hypothetical protein